MNRKSQLHQYLNRQYQSGRMDSEGQFTIAVDGAAKKLSQSALASPVSWLLKVIQAGVAETATRSISVSLFAGFVDVKFEGELPWRAPSLFELLGNIQGKTDQAISALLLGLLDRLVPDMLMLFVFKGQAEALFWTGSELLIDELETLPEENLLSVQIGSFNYNLSGNLAFEVQRQRDFAQALVDSAHLCPIPLSLDGRRIDTLYHLDREADTFGLLTEWGYVIDERPSLRLPLREPSADVFREVNIPSQLTKFHLREKQAQGEVPDLVSYAWILRAHFTTEEVLVEGIPRKAWTPNKSTSGILFVKHGIIVDFHPLPLPKEHLSLSIIVDCQGLLHDLSGFQLVQNKVLEERKKIALKSVLKSLPQDVTPVIEKSKWKGGPLKFLASLFFNIPTDLVDEPELMAQKIEESYLRLRSSLNSNPLA